MYQGKKTLTELAQELERQAESKKDFKAPCSLMEMSVSHPHKVTLPEVAKDIPQDVLKDLNLAKPTLQFRLGDKFTGAPTELMHDQLGGYCKIPSKYYEKCRAEKPALLAINVNTWLREAKETRLVRTLDGKARAFLSNRYRTIDNSEVAEAALPILIQESKKLGTVKVVSSEVTENRLYIKAVSERLTYEVKKGDVVQAGIVISNSEVGLGSVRVEPILFRLWCDNGAIMEEAAVRKFHLGRQYAELEAAIEVFRDETRQADDRVFIMKLRDVVRAAFDDARFEQLKGLTIDSTTRKIKAPIQDVVEEVASRYGMGDRVKDSFLKNLIEGGDTTQWGLANAVTATANTAADYEEATRLERVGGEIITMDGKRWKELADAA